MDSVYTVKEVAKLLKVDYRTILREINRGNLVAHKVGRIFLVNDQNLSTYLNKSGVQPLRISVAVVIKEDKVLLVKRKFKEGKLHWQFPAGRVRFGEKTSTRSEIECLQETGVHCRSVKKVGYRIHPDTKAVINYWICEYVAGDAYNVDSSENSSVRWVGLVEPERMFTSDYYEPVKVHLRSLYESV